MSTRPPSRVVFVGNIPYGNIMVSPILIPSTRLTFHHQGLSEEQITDIFSSAGKVERFRLVYDSETGKPKGFGFADYPDTGRSSSLTMTLRRYILPES
jgi:cleavage stimulation factor subunit 2